MPIPSPKSGESQDDFMGRCMSNMKGEFPDIKQRTAVCMSSFRKGKEIAKDWHLLEFIAPIQESSFVNDEFLIKGIAINETTTLNNHKYIAEELEKAAPGLINKPLLVDHDNRVESIKGRVKHAYFDSMEKNVKFEAKIMDKNIQEMVKDGRLISVSIGAYAKDLIKEEDTGVYIAKGLSFGELSLVAVPADPNANFMMAMDNAFKLKESIESDLLITERRFGDKLTEQVDKENNVKLQELETEKQKLLEEVKSMKEEKRQSKIHEYKKLCTEKKIAEKDVSKVSEETLTILIEQLREIKLSEPTPEQKPKAETKGMMSEKESDGLDNFMVERLPNGKTALFIQPNVRELMQRHSDPRFIGGFTLKE